MNRQLVLGGIFDAGNDVGECPRPHDRLRPNFINARVGRVQLQENVVAPDVAFNEPPQVGLNSFPFRVHEYRPLLRFTEAVASQ
jgi:hypothetical protein